MLHQLLDWFASPGNPALVVSGCSALIAVMSLRYNQKRDAVRVRVKPEMERRGSYALNVRVINDSATVTARVVEVGLRVAKSEDFISRSVGYTPQHLPVSILPKDSIVIPFIRTPEEVFDKRLTRIRYAFVITADGKEFRAKGRTLATLRTQCHRAQTERLVKKMLRGTRWQRLLNRFGFAKAPKVADIFGVELPAANATEPEHVHPPPPSTEVRTPDTDASA